MKKIIAFILVLCLVLALYSHIFHNGEMVSFEETYKSAMGVFQRVGNIYSSAKDVVINVTSHPDIIGVKLEQYFAYALTRLNEFITPLAGGFVTLFNELGNKIGGFFTNLASALGEFFTSLGDRIYNYFTNLGNRISNFFQGIWNKIVRAFGGEIHCECEYPTSCIDCACGAPDCKCGDERCQYCGEYLIECDCTIR